MNPLLKSQTEALAYVKSNALFSQKSALVRAQQIMEHEGLLMLQYSKALGALQDKAPIDVSFHPDRPSMYGETVVANLLKSAEYKNQYETGISNGGLTAFEGGNRDLWEMRLFGAAYHQPDAEVGERPKYGALNLMSYWDGACPRFGSCFFRLKPEVAQRCSFAYGDSSTNPTDMAVIDLFDSILTELIADISLTGSALGSDSLQLNNFLQRIVDHTYSRKAELINSALPGRSLDHYIEVHIHGSLKLATDVMWLAADSSFLSTKCGDQLIELADQNGFPIVWNPRFELATDQVPADFRGSIMVQLADHIATDGVLNAAKIGQAVAALKESPKDWEVWGSVDQTLQFLKQIWHVLVAYGHANNEAA